MTPGAAAGYAIALVSVAVAAGLTLLLRSLLAPSFAPAFFAAVIVSARYGGLGPGLLATALSAALTEALLPAPFASVMGGALRVVTFLLVGALAATLCARAAAGQQRAEDLARARGELLTQEQDARADAETAGRAKDEFLATLSHELRTPLNAVLGWLWWLRQGELDPPRHARAVETIDRNTRALAQLIEDLVDVSRIVTGKLRIQTAPVELRPVVEAAIEAVRPAAAAKTIEIVAVLADDGGSVLGDAERLQQVVWNLLANAVKYTPAKGRIEVRLARRDASTEIVVSDTGRGISAERLPRLFEGMRTTHAGAPSHGLGLGLAIVHHLVGAHGGTIRAESPGEGQGATFTVTLPRLADITVDRASDRAPAPAGADRRPLRELRVLVVEDDRDAREALVDALAGFGADVLAARSVPEALTILERDKPHVLVSDIRLPGQDGYDLIRQLRALETTRGGHTPAVALTAYPRVEDRAHALDAGYEMHVAKPVEPSALAGVIATLARRA